MIQYATCDWLSSKLTDGSLSLSYSPTLKGNKLAPYRDWRSSLCNWRLCQLQSHVTQKLGWISKIRP